MLIADSRNDKRLLWIGGVLTFTGGLTLAKGAKLTVTLSGGEPADVSVSIPPVDGSLRHRRPIGDSDAAEVADECCPGGVCADGTCCEPPPFAAEGKAVAGAVLPQQGHWRSSILTAIGAGPLCRCFRRAFLASFWFCCRCCCSCLCLCFCSCPRLAGAASCFRRCPLPFLIDLQQFLLLLLLSKPRAVAWAQARC